MDRFSHGKAVERLGRGFVQQALFDLETILPEASSEFLPDRKDTVDLKLVYNNREYKIEIKTNLKPWTYSGKAYKTNFTDRGADLILGTPNTHADGPIPVIGYTVYIGIRDKAWKIFAKSLACRLKKIVEPISGSYMHRPSKPSILSRPSHVETTSSHVRLVRKSNVNPDGGGGLSGYAGEAYNPK